MQKRLLQIQQLDAKMQLYGPLQHIKAPSTGWLKAIRTTLGLSLKQLGNRLQKSKQNVAMLEQREKDGNISLNSLREVAGALDMELIYGFVPKDITLEQLIDRKATELATKIVLRTSQSMKLEGQQNKDARIKKAIGEKAQIFKTELPKILWD
ncbi:mobile mystery protein A [Niabella drilacis]|uniref:Transcriptional regulator, XRE family n=1 Tax=Niabella drilacis (strain DSM 25811 / CCM 8410 / CCUG 62505 / LMG 26954 / E90) TaxID=1285928 RepID=A0A1G6N8X1_NIADE|nr:mobile mystery protein A [Niabella drilacis]SDC64312.1 transcriptional regulator, XRE family [Niabella drilacis]